MTSASVDDALWEFVAVLNAPVGCVSHARLYAQPLGGDRYTIVLENGNPARLITRQGRANLRLSIVHQCQIRETPPGAGTFVVSSTYYAYEILDAEGNEILTYHWHPSSSSHVAYPHLHLSDQVRPVELRPVPASGRPPDNIRLAELHVPTGRILLEDVVRLLIEEDDFGVVPLPTNWRAVLEQNRQSLHQERSW